VRDPDGATLWWTFGGTGANVELASVLGGLAPTTPPSGLAIRLADDTPHADVVERLRGQLDAPPPSLPAELADAYKFADVLPESAARAMLDARDRDPFAVTETTSRPIRAVALNERGPRP
jgi:hypothetical protein